MKTNLTFGQATDALKQGYRVARSGWNGKNMWLVLLVPGAEAILGKHTTIGDGVSRPVDPCIAMKTAGDTIQPGWLTSQADILATDWGILD